MSFGARYGFLVLLAGLAASPASAQDRPAGAWKDPPTHDATAPDAAKTPDKTAESPKPAETVTPARERGMAATRQTRRAAVTERRQARRGREVMTRRIARTPSPRIRVGSRARSTPYAVATSRFAPLADEGYEPVPHYPLTRLRQEGWGNLVSGRRARRLVEREEHGPLFGFPRGQPDYMSVTDREDDGRPD